MTAPTPLRLVTGVNWTLEDAADEILSRDRRTSGLKPNWLSRDQLAMRQSREIGNELGVCDPALRQGIFRRAFNPASGKRPNGHGRSQDD